MDDSILKVILGPVAVALFLLLVAAWREIRSLQHQKETLVTKVAELEKAHAETARKFAETSAQKDTEIERQKKEILTLHSALSEKPSSSGGAWT